MAASPPLKVFLCHASEAVIVCFSSVSVNKEGYVQKEIKYAQEVQKEKPEGTIFFIPLQLEACEMPFSLRGIQWGHYYEVDGYENVEVIYRLPKSLKLRKPNNSPYAVARDLSRVFGRHKCRPTKELRKVS